MLDITDPKAPKALGNVAMGGEPTTTVVIGGFAFAAIALMLNGVLLLVGDALKHRSGLIALPRLS